MSSFSDVQTFVREANKVRSIPALRSLMEGIVSELGFEYFSLGHHVSVLSGSMVQIIHYPQVWTEILLERNYISDDPILIASQNSAAGFKWSDISKLIKLTKRQEQILEEAKGAGMGDGFTVPMHIPGECAGSCSFGRKAGQTLNDEILPAAQFVGCFAFEAARKIARLQAPADNRDIGNHPSLTTRQLDCVVLVGRGNTYSETARLLGIRPDTVHKHIENAKMKYRVTTRDQLIIRALFDNQISFRDVLPH